jgi:hypothetical protein
MNYARELKFAGVVHYAFDVSAFRHGTDCSGLREGVAIGA